MTKNWDDSPKSWIDSPNPIFLIVKYPTMIFSRSCQGPFVCTHQGRSELFWKFAFGITNFYFFLLLSSNVCMIELVESIIHAFILLYGLYFKLRWPWFLIKIRLICDYTVFFWLINYKTKHLTILLLTI